MVNIILVKSIYLHRSCRRRSACFAFICSGFMGTAFLSFGFLWLFVSSLSVILLSHRITVLSFDLRFFEVKTQKNFLWVKVLRRGGGTRIFWTWKGGWIGGAEFWEQEGLESFYYFLLWGGCGDGAAVKWKALRLDFLQQKRICPRCFLRADRK